MKILNALCLLLAFAVPSEAETDAGRQFSVIAVRIDCSAAELAGWQVHARFADSDTRIVGIEGGSHPAFDSAPQYDPAALNGGEIILAALAAQQTLPAGPTTVAVLHVEHSAGRTPRLEVIDWIAVGADGNETPATVLQENGE